jgi:predicted phage replisome organizer/uncharacterized phage protein (TIGR02220 family)
MSDIHWVKLSTAMFDDEKIRVIESMPSGGDICLIWVKLIVLAGRTNDSGLIYLTKNLPYTDDMLAKIFGKPVETVRLALAAFVKLDMVEVTGNNVIVLVNWEKHQCIDGMDRIRELTRERVQKFREKQRQITGNVTGNAKVTPGNALDLDLDLDLDSDSEIEKKIDSRAGTRQCVEIIEFLNTTTHRRYSSSSKSTLRLLKARFNDGHTLDDFKVVITDRTKRWGSDPKMMEYLRPETLFGTKFDSYLAQASSGGGKIDPEENYRCPTCGKRPTGHFGYEPYCSRCKQVCQEVSGKDAAAGKVEE